MVKMKIEYVVLHLMVGLSFQSCLDHFGHPLKEGAPRNNGGCAPETCTGGHWVPDKHDLLPDCFVCNAWGEPHFTAFNGAKFAWQETCNTALTQAGDSKTPDFGVFMDFYDVSPNSYVGSPTTYQDDKDTKVVLYPDPFGNPSVLTKVKVNRKDPLIQVTSNPTKLLDTSVYAWTVESDFGRRTFGKKSKLCVRLYGKSKILVELCDSIIHIWAPPKNVLFDTELGGLCGTTDTGSTAFHGKKLVGRRKDGVAKKYTNPGGWYYHAPRVFGDSWKAMEQTKPGCKGSGKRKRSIRNVEGYILHTKCVDEAEHPNSLTGDHHDMCMGVHKGNGSTGDDHLEACKYDLCIVANDTEHRRLGITVDMGLELHTDIHSRTRAHIHHANTMSIDTTRPRPTRPQRPRPTTRPHTAVTPNSFASFIFNVQDPGASQGDQISDSLGDLPGRLISDALGAFQGGPISDIPVAFSGGEILASNGAIIGVPVSASAAKKISSSQRPSQRDQFQPFQRRPQTVQNQPYQRRPQTVQNQPFQRRSQTVQNQAFQRRSQTVQNQPFQRRSQTVQNQPFRRRSQTVQNQPLQMRSQTVQNPPFQRRSQMVQNQPFQRRSQTVQNQPAG